MRNFLQVKVTSAQDHTDVFTISELRILSELGMQRHGHRHRSPWLNDQFRSLQRDTHSVFYFRFSHRYHGINLVHDNRVPIRTKLVKIFR